VRQSTASRSLLIFDAGGQRLPELVTRAGVYDLWLAFSRDPDGNSLALLAEAPRGFDPVPRKWAD
jgi:hypothetical protein